MRRVEPSLVEELVLGAADSGERGLQDFEQALFVPISNDAPDAGQSPSFVREQLGEAAGEDQPAPRDLRDADGGPVALISGRLPG